MKLKYFKNGKIYSMISNDDFFKYMLVSDGKIIFTSDEEIPVSRYLKKKNIKFEEVDLEGKTVIPSFCDSHIHFMHSALTIDNLDLSNIKKFSQFIKKIELKYNKLIKKYDEVIKKDPGIAEKIWITGGGWDKNNWDKEGFPDKNDLKKFKNINIALYSKDYHAILLNQKAIDTLYLNNPPDFILKKYKITRDEFEKNSLKDFNGEKIGIFLENSLKFISRLISDLIKNDENEIGKKVRKLIKKFNKSGITAVSDCSLLWEDSSFKVFNKLDQKKLTIRNMIAIPEDSIDKFIDLNLKTGIGSDKVKIGPVKLLYDGSLGSQTAFLSEPYENSENFNVGIKNYSPEYINQIIDKITKNGLGIAIHAIGDRANKEVISIFERIRVLNKNIFLRLEHAQMLDNETIQMANGLRINFVMQPVHIDQDISTAIKYLGKRKNMLYRFKSLQKKGFSISFSTDYPVAPLNPFYGIYCAVTHRGFNLNKKLLSEKEKISLFDAVRNYTFVSHKHSLFPNSGLLTEGYSADFVILNKDIFNLNDSEEILSLKVLSTFFEGEKIC